MNKSKISGWKDVYTFTLIQTLRTGSFRAMTIVFCLIALVSMPLSGLLVSSMSDSAIVDATTIKNVLVIDESGFPATDWSPFTAGTIFEAIPITEATAAGKDTLLETIRTTDTDTLLLHITLSSAAFEFEYMKSPDSTIKDKEITALSSLLQAAFNQNRLISSSIGTDQIQLAGASVTSTIAIASDTGTGNSGAPASAVKAPLEMAEYYVLLAGIVVLIIILMVAGESIATSIVTEKSNRVIEYLMTSIRPLALITGKVLAILSTTVIQVISVLVCLFLSNIISSQMGSNGGDIMTSLGFSTSSLEGLNPVNILLALLSFFLGLVFFALLAGLAGATVSRIEELAEGIMLFNISLIAGAYLCIAYAISQMSGGGDNALSYFTTLFPLSSPFVLPSGLLLNRISPAMACGAIAIQLAALLLLVMFVSKVYEVLLMYQGNRVKLGAMISMSKTAKQGGRKHEK